MRKEDKGNYWSVADTVKEYGHFYLVDTTLLWMLLNQQIEKRMFQS